MSRWKAIAALWCVAAAAGCATGPRVREIPGMPRTADDPALQGAPAKPPLEASPPGTRAEGSTEVDEKTTWLPVAQFDLLPNASRKFTVSFTQGVIVFARAIWSGSAGPVSVVVSRAGSTVASAKPVSGPPDHGAALAQAAISSAGSADILVTNVGTTSVTVRATAGTLPLSAVH
jgi:hypothetical protein